MSFLCKTFSKLHFRQLCTERVSQFSPQTLLDPKNLERTFDCFQNVKYPWAMMAKSNKGDKYAAVLIPLCVNSHKELSILYTRRAGTLSRHTRQISFPGGMKDETDKSFEDCALRETEEEIGLPKDKVTILGTGALLRPVQTAAIMPIVGLIHDINIDELIVNRHEVDEVFKIPICELASINNRGHTQFKKGYSAPVFTVDQYRIWGITGYLTNLFLHCFLPKECEYSSQIQFVRPYKTPL